VKCFGLDAFAASAAAISFSCAAAQGQPETKVGRLTGGADTQEGPPTGEQKATNQLEREKGGSWRVVFCGQERHPLHIKGWDIVRRLFQKPNTWIHSLELEGHPPECLPRHQTDDTAGDQALINQFKDDLRQIDIELRSDRKRLEEGDPEAEADILRLEARREEVIRQLRPYANLHGRGRRLTQGNQAANATQRIRSALRELKNNLWKKWDLPALADHLDSFVESSDDTWAYRPDTQQAAWSIQ
jgi:hypothetical protein